MAYQCVLCNAKKETNDEFVRHIKNDHSTIFSSESFVVEHATTKEQDYDVLWYSSIFI